jgi:hypothetical protein
LTTIHLDALVVTDASSRRGRVFDIVQLEGKLQGRAAAPRRRFSPDAVVKRCFAVRSTVRRAAAV